MQVTHNETTAAPGYTEVAKEELDKMLRYHVGAAMGVGLVPFPLLDFAALTGVQLNLVRRLAKAYDIPFFQDTARNLISSLVGSSLATAMVPSLVSSLAKAIPFLGQVAGIITAPVVFGSATYALGKVFIQHFASGGTFLTFDPDKVKAYYAEMFQEGKDVAAEMKPTPSTDAEISSETLSEDHARVEKADSEEEPLKEQPEDTLSKESIIDDEQTQEKSSSRKRSAKTRKQKST